MSKKAIYYNASDDLIPAYENSENSLFVNNNLVLLITIKNHLILGDK
jgi:hypothetical protein